MNEKVTQRFVALGQTSQFVKNAKALGNIT